MLVTMLKRYSYNDRVSSLLQKMVHLETGSMAESDVRTLKACRRPGVHTSLQNALLHLWTLRRALCLGATCFPTYVCIIQSLIHGPKNTLKAESWRPKRLLYMSYFSSHCEKAQD